MVSRRSEWRRCPTTRWTFDDRISHVHLLQRSSAPEPQPQRFKALSVNRRRLPEVLNKEQYEQSIKQKRIAVPWRRTAGGRGHPRNNRSHDHTPPVHRRWGATPHSSSRVQQRASIILLRCWPRYNIPAIRSRLFLLRTGHASTWRLTYLDRALRIWAQMLASTNGWRRPSSATICPSGQ